MNDFTARYQTRLNGVLSGFDRIVFHGTLPLVHEAGMKGYLWAHGLGLKDFGKHAEKISRQTRKASQATMEAASRPVRYLNSGKDDKQAMARAVALQDGIASGPIAPSLPWSCARAMPLRAMRRRKRSNFEEAPASAHLSTSTGCTRCSAS